MSVSRVDPLNSTLQALGAGETYLGLWSDVRNEGNITILLHGEVAAAGTLYIEFTMEDQLFVDSQEDIEILDINDAQPVIRLTAGSFYRIRYVNGPTPLATFRLETQKNKGKNVGFTLVDFIDVLETIELNTSITANMTNVMTLAKGELLTVVDSLEQTVVSYTAPALKAVWITKILCSGQGNSKWRFFQAADWKAVRRIGAGEINTEFNFGSPGLKIPAGVTVDVKVFHAAAGKVPDFEASIFGYEEP